MTHTMKYDGQRHIEAVNREAALREQVANVSEALNEAYEAGGFDRDPGKLSKYTAQQQRHGQLSRELEAVRREVTNLEAVKPLDRRKAKDQSDDPLARLIRHGDQALTEQEKSEYFSASGIVPGFTIPLIRQAAGDPQRGDLSTGDGRTDAAKPTYVDEYPIARLAFAGAVSDVARPYDTEDGNDYKVPREDSASQEGQLISNEAATITNTTTNPAHSNFDTVLLKAFTMGSGPVKISKEIVQDAAFPIVEYLTRVVLRRMGRGWNKQFTTGAAGATAPTGVSTAASVGKAVAAASGSATFTWLDVVDLIHSVDAAYRMGDEGFMEGFMAPQGSVGFMMHDTVCAEVRKLRDDDNRPLWLPSIREGAAATLFGYPVWINNHMQTWDITRANRSMLFGNFAYYGVRNVMSAGIRVYDDSRTAQSNIVEVLGYSRRDGRPVGGHSGTTFEAVKAMTNAS